MDPMAKGTHTAIVLPQRLRGMLQHTAASNQRSVSEEIRVRLERSFTISETRGSTIDVVIQLLNGLR